MRTMSNGLVRYALDRGVATIELHDPPANAYSVEMMRDLDEAILEARYDDDCHVLLLTGAGDQFFCAGADIDVLREVSPRFKYYFSLHANETLLRLEHTAKLVIAALEGHCVGGGLEIALAADLRIAAAKSGVVGLPEVALGLLPGTGGTQRLSRLLGKARALQLMCEGTLVDYDRAEALGLVNAVYERDGFLDRVLEYARSYCPPSKASLAVGSIKRAVQTGAELGLEQGLALERELQQRLFESADAAEAFGAYNEKRKPVFRGA